ncbi:MAG TPA: circularly permuted type 2 ATP-grasp protein [Fibrobacteraceae bacterium]|nr:circularly permuted type 2 ATP-grasp protein [Fibrobacteraceae bacterium]
MPFTAYDTESFYDELILPTGGPRPVARLLVQRIQEIGLPDLRQRELLATRTLRSMGITFNHYKDNAIKEKIFPFDVIPRIVPRLEWERVEQGLIQRITALNLFLGDLYGEGKILRDGVIPEEVIRTSKYFTPQCVGLKPPGGVWCHISGMDLVRHGDGSLYVLEDNLRTPSGVSYVMGSREVLKKSLPQLFGKYAIRPVEDYPRRLLETLLSVAPPVSKPVVAVMTPGSYNSAYFEHSFLAQQMGVELVEGRDLVVVDGNVMMRTTRGLRRVDVIYRRVDDEFLDPLEFRSDSMLGVPGIMDCYRKGRVTLVNAPGTGVADDKVVYAYVPRIIRYYLNEEPILPNVPTYLCSESDSLKYVLEHLAELVVKPAGESGGYGVVIGPKASAGELETLRKRIEAEPRNYIAQPVLSLSRVPTLLENGVEGRHVDLRPFVLSGKDGVWVLPGGLTRVALRKGSLIVNSSQGGGSKDTWVLQEDLPC